MVGSTAGHCHGFVVVALIEMALVGKHDWTFVSFNVPVNRKPSGIPILFSF
jgi:hypothetical protein